MGAGAQAVGEQAARFVSADGAASRAGHVAVPRVDLYGRASAANAQLDNPFRRRRPVKAAAFLLGVAPPDGGRFAVDALHPHGVPYAQRPQALQIIRQVVEHIFDCTREPSSAPSRVRFLFEYRWRWEVRVMTSQNQVRPVSTVMHVRCPDRLPEETYRQVLELLADLSSVVQALPPAAALVELKGALRYHGTDTRRLGEVLRVRAISRLGVDVRVGIGPTVTVAATASAQIPPPGGVLAVAPGHAVDWLAALPVEALHGIGERQAAVLHNYGIHTVGLLAAVSPVTVQRLLGGRAGRTASDRARGIDPRPVIPRALPASAAMRHRFEQHVLDGADVRAALLTLAVDLGLLLRRRGQAARALTLQLAFAGGGQWEKTRRLAEPSAHEEDLRVLAYQLMDAAGLQRGRLIRIQLRGEDLVDANQVAQQISLDVSREARLVAEGAVDRVRDKFGPDVIGPATVFRRAS